MAKKLCLFILMLISTVGLVNAKNTGDATANLDKVAYNHIFQVATIGSLVKGVYDGNFSYGELFDKGYQGAGTFNAIDGEMVAVDGIFFQMKSDGKLRKVKPNEKTPFAEVVKFKAKSSKSVNNAISYKDLKSTMDGMIDKKNVPYAIRIDGQFSKLNLRTLRKQVKPYPPLAEAVKNQDIIDLKNITATLVGFWFPEYWTGIAVPGYH